MTDERVVVTQINDWSEVPPFASEAEEAEYWRTHGPSERLLKTFVRRNDADLPRPRRRRRACPTSN